MGSGDANQPVMTGDKISTGDGGRWELQLDYANTLRLGPNSKATVANLTRKNIQIQLGEGILNYAVSKDGESEPESILPMYPFIRLTTTEFSGLSRPGR